MGHAGPVPPPRVDTRARPAARSMSQIVAGREGARPDAAVDGGPGEAGARKDGGQAKHLRGGGVFGVLHSNLVSCRAYLAR